MSDLDVTPRPRPLSGRGWIVLAVTAAVVLALYALVLRFYNAEGGLTVTSNAGDGADGVVVVVEPQSVDPATNTASLHLTFTTQDPDLVDASGRLTQNLRFLVQSSSGNEEVRVLAGEVPGQRTVSMGVDGELAQYPFDRYSGVATVVTDTYVRNSDGTFTSTGDVYTTINATGGVNGWDTVVAVDEYPASSQAEIDFTRAFSTQVFALLLLTLAVLLAISAVVVAFLVYTDRRRAEVALMSWTAALLFALPALRNFMPNGPPIGASIDMYVYLWVIVGGILAAIGVILGWGRQTRVRLEAEAQAASMTGD